MRIGKVRFLILNEDLLITKVLELDEIRFLFPFSDSHWFNYPRKGNV